MASSINASTSGAGGLISTADSSGVLNIQTAGTTAIAVDASQNVTLTNALPVASGGTGAATLTANNVLLGNGTSAVQAVAPGTSGNVLTSNGTTWTSAALPASPSVGVGQTWQNVTASRASGTTYTNTTGKPIQVSVTGSQVNATISITVDGNVIASQGTTSSGVGQNSFVTAIVPDGSTYLVTVGTLVRWWELR